VQPNIAYTFCVLRYVHDPVVGEMLNVGVLLYAPTAAYLGFRFEQETRRLSATFADFDVENFRHYIARMETALQHIADAMQPFAPLSEPPQSIEAITHLVFPDTGGSFQPGVVLAGIADNLPVELELLFDRMVASQYKRETKILRNDEEVWTV